jgi:hypothetical protein
MDESFIGDEKKHFPNLSHMGINIEAQYDSIGYLAHILLGSTGWTGMKRDGRECWQCTYRDLTKKGKDLYNMVKNLYKGFGTIELQTWVDT